MSASHERRPIPMSPGARCRTPTQRLRFRILPGLLLGLAAFVGCAGDDGREPDGLPQPDGGSDDANLPDGSMVTLDSGAAIDSGLGSSDASPPDAGNPGDADGVLPWLDESQPPPPLDPLVFTSMADGTRFLYEGDNPIQRGVAPGTIKPERVTVLRGKVHSRDGRPIPGVSIRVLNGSEYGESRTRQDGVFDIAVNGGGFVTVDYDREGFLPVQRRLSTRWNEYAWIDDVTMIPVDPVVTRLQLGSGDLQVARGSKIQDPSGERQATVVMPAGTRAELILPDGSTQSVPALSFRATEYTVGESGPSAMPGELPPETGYTYAVELGADEAIAAGATEVRFSRPVYLYVENFLGFPTGEIVPVGYYDRQQGRWIASENGRVIAILRTEAGRATLDLDGSGAAAEEPALTALGIDDAELRALATLYAPGQTLWRSPIPHLTPWDCNWPYGPPMDAEVPELPSIEEELEPTEEEECETGSVIHCLSQVLGEVVSLPGSPIALTYRTDRLESGAFSATGRRLRLALTGASVPPSVKAIELRVNIAGRLFREIFDPLPNLRVDMLWDGRDAYGRRVPGPTQAILSLAYDYPQVYYPAPSDFRRSFGRFSDGAFADASFRPDSELRLQVGRRSQAAERALIMSPPTDVALWNVDVHHRYAPRDQTLYLGTGESRYVGTAESRRVDGMTDSLWDTLVSLRAIEVAPDGSVLLLADINTADVGRRWVVLRRRTDGSFEHVAGAGNRTGRLEDDMPALEASLAGSQGSDFSVGSDGSIYLCFPSDGTVRRIGPDGRMHIVAGKSNSLVREPIGDEGPARDAFLGYPISTELDRDGNLFIAELTGHRVRKVSPEGIITTVAGTGVAGNAGDGGPAHKALLNAPRALAFGPDGALYVATSGSPAHGGGRIRRVGPDGRISTILGGLPIEAAEQTCVAPRKPTCDRGELPDPQGQTDGTCPIPGFHGACADGADPLDLPLTSSVLIAFSPSGELHFHQGNALRKINAAGRVVTVAGNARPWNSFSPIHPVDMSPLLKPLTASCFSFAPDGALLLADDQLKAIRRVGGPARALGDAATITIPDPDLGQLYIFDRSGRHLRTVDTVTDRVIFEFSHDEAGRLAEIRQPSGHSVRVVREASGAPSAIVTSDASGTEKHRADLTIDARGHLVAIRTAGGGLHEMAYSEDGLLRSFSEPSGKRSTYEYDALGRLLRSEALDGRGWRLETVEDKPGTLEVHMTAHGGGTTSRRRENTPSGDVRVTVTRPDGLPRVETTRRDGRVVTEGPDGTVATVTLTPDPRFGAAASFISRHELRDPASGEAQVMTQARTAEFEIDGDPTSPLRRQEDTLTVAGRVFRVSHDAATRTQSWSNASTGRGVFVEHDSSGQVAQFRIQNTASGDRRGFTYSYDASGNLTSSDGPRTDVSDLYSFVYANGELASATNPLGHTESFLERDAEGRLERATLASGLEVRYGHDAAGRVTRVVEGDRVTEYSYDASRASETETKPGGGRWTYEFKGPDKQLTEILTPTGERAAVAYDEGQNRVETRLFDVDGAERGVFWFASDAASRVVTESHGSREMSMRLHPFFPLPVELTGGGRTTTYSYDGPGRIVGVRAPDGAETRFAYGADESTTVTDAAGRVTRMGVGVLGDLASYQDASSGTTVYLYDAAGSVTRMVDSMNVSSTYERDALGRVVSMRVGSSGDDDAFYTYDEEPNGVGKLTTARNGTGSTSFGYDQHGQIVHRTEVIGSVSLPMRYGYDPDGVLTSIAYPSGMVVTYALNRSGGVVSIRAVLPEASSESSILTDVRYLPFGGIESFRLGDQAQRIRIRRYDNGYRLVRDSIEGVTDWEYVYDSHDDLVELRDGVANRTQVLEHDGVGRIIGATEADSYGALGFTYNAVGDRLSAIENGATTTYTYAAATGRLVSAQTGSEPAVTFGYDTRGSLTSDGRLSYRYSPSGKLTSVRDASNDAALADYRYNTRSERVQKSLPNTTTLFVYGAEASLLGEYDASGGAKSEIIWLGSMPVATVRYSAGGAEVLWVHADQTDAPRFISNAAGQVLWSWQSDPFGVSAPNEDVDGDGVPLEFGLRFPGQYFDGETGLHHNGYRSYSPRLGRYLQSDPIGILGGVNGYIYAYARPTIFVDPYGLEGVLPSNYIVGRHEFLTAPGSPYRNIPSHWELPKDAKTFWDLPKEARNRPWGEVFTHPIDAAKKVYVCTQGLCFERFENEAKQCRGKVDWGPKGPSVTTNEIIHAIREKAPKDVIAVDENGKTRPFQEVRDEARRARQQALEPPVRPMPRPPLGEVASPSITGAVPGRSTPVPYNAAPNGLPVGGGGGGKIPARRPDLQM